MTGRALVVDDDPFMAKTLAEILALKGWEVTTAFDGRAAVKAALDNGFDVVLMDIKMPGLDGVAALKAMKAAKPNLNVVLMTAFAAPEVVSEAEREGVLRVMSKPLNIPSLLEVLGESLTQRRRVLVVDTDAAFLRTLAEVLQLRGFETILATSLDHATQLMHARQPGAVLLHMHLGNTRASDAVRAVHEASPAVALVLYSGRPDAAEEMQKTLPKEWVRAYLQKPFAVDEIAGILNAIGHR